MMVSKDIYIFKVCDLYCEVILQKEYINLTSQVTVDLWYTWTCSSKKTTSEETPQMLRMHRT
jgi:hypothetical protein